MRAHPIKVFNAYKSYRNKRKALGYFAFTIKGYVGSRQADNILSSKKIDEKLKSFVDNFNLPIEEKDYQFTVRENLTRSPEFKYLVKQRKILGTHHDLMKKRP